MNEQLAILSIKSIDFYKDSHLLLRVKEYEKTKYLAGKNNLEKGAKSFEKGN